MPENGAATSTSCSRRARSEVAWLRPHPRPRTPHRLHKMRRRPLSVRRTCTPVRVHLLIPARRLGLGEFCPGARRFRRGEAQASPERNRLSPIPRRRRVGTRRAVDHLQTVRPNRLKVASFTRDARIHDKHHLLCSFLTLAKVAGTGLKPLPRMTTSRLSRRLVRTTLRGRGGSPSPDGCLVGGRPLPADLFLQGVTSDWRGRRRNLAG